MLAIAGFSNPMTEPGVPDLTLWMPDPKNPPKDLAQAQARFLLTQVGDQFCDLLTQENEASKAHMSSGKYITIIRNYHISKLSYVPSSNLIRWF